MTLINCTFNNSPLAVEAIVSLHFPQGTILDVTAGDGVFYKRTSRRVVMGDIRKLKHLDYMGDCIYLPFADSTFDLVVFDPPFKVTHKNFGDRYGKTFNTETKVNRIYRASIPELFRVARRGVIVKVSDGSDGHGTHMRHICVVNWIKALTGLELYDWAMVVRPNDNGMQRPGTQQHFFRRNVSMFLIWKFIAKEPFTAPRW